MNTTYVAATPATVHLSCYQGDSWSQTFRFLAGDGPVNLDGLELRAQARSTLGETFDLVASVVGDPAEGTIQLALPEGGLPADSYQYDLQTDDQGTISSWLRGRLRVERDVTK